MAFTYVLDGRAAPAVSDSTLSGHFPLEPHVIAKALFGPDGVAGVLSPGASDPASTIGTDGIDDAVSALGPRRSGRARGVGARPSSVGVAGSFGRLQSAMAAAPEQPYLLWQAQELGAADDSAVTNVLAPRRPGAPGRPCSAPDRPPYAARPGLRERADDQR